MWSEDQIKEKLKENLKPKRYDHVIGVRDTAIELAKLYNEDLEKAKLAALIHDYCKNMSDEEIISKVEKYKLMMDEISKISPQLMHGAIAAAIAKEDMGITDEDLLNAVTYHTTGRENMSILEKIIYIADYIEPSRNFPGVDDLRKSAFEDLDKALLKAFDNTIKFVIDKGQFLHLDTIKGRNYILSKNRR